MTPVQSFAEQVTANVEKVMVGTRPAIEMVLVALLCEGHVLVEDVPGVGKTMLARSVAASLGLSSPFLPAATASFIWLTSWSASGC
jgi:MoxR-like ATPase